MKTHITTLNNMAGTASLAHRRVLKVAQSIGCHEMGLSFYPLKPDYAKEIDKRLDGIIAPLNYGDIVIFQYPSWIGVNYDESFVNKIKSYRDTKLIIFVQDIQKLMFDSEQAILDMEIKTLNKADLLILPSKKMHRYLKENGLDEKPVIYQTIWDMPSDICFVDHAVTRCFHFAGNYNRFPFLAEYHGKTPIYQYDANKPDRENDDSFCWRGYFEQEKLMHELSKGGFGLVWSDGEYFDRYYSMNQPYKLGTNLAAGIPVIVAVVGIGRMNNSRSERQARGRAGRQGDPGFSQYYVSLEDDIVGAEDDDKLQRYIDGKKRIGKRKIKRIVNQCQKLSVESEEMNRKKSLQYDQVLQRQRDLIYATRKNLLDGASVEQEKIVGIAKENISDFVNHFDCIQSNKKHGRRRGRKKDSDKNTNTQQYTSMLNRYILDNISYKLDAGLSKSDMQSAATVSDYLMLRVYQGLSRQRERIGDEEAYEQFVREATLKAVDDGWVELIDYLEQLKYAVAGRASAQRNVMFEYQNEAFESFLDTEKAVKCNIIRNILLSDVKIGKDGRLQVIYP